MQYSKCLNSFYLILVCIVIVVLSCLMYEKYPAVWVVITLIGCSIILVGLLYEAHLTKRRTLSLKEGLSPCEAVSIKGDKEKTFKF